MSFHPVAHKLESDNEILKSGEGGKVDPYVYSMSELDEEIKDDSW